MPDHPATLRHSDTGYESVFVELQLDRCRVVEIGLRIRLAVAASHAVDQGLDVRLFESAYAQIIGVLSDHAPKVSQGPP